MRSSTWSTDVSRPVGSVTEVSRRWLVASALALATSHLTGCSVFGTTRNPAQSTTISPTGPAPKQSNTVDRLKALSGESVRMIGLLVGDTIMKTTLAIGDDRQFRWLRGDLNGVLISTIAAGAGRLVVAAAPGYRDRIQEVVVGERDELRDVAKVSDPAGSSPDVAETGMIMFTKPHTDASGQSYSSIELVDDEGQRSVLKSPPGRVFQAAVFAGPDQLLTVEAAAGRLGTSAQPPKDTRVALRSLSGERIRDLEVPAGVDVGTVSATSEHICWSHVRNFDRPEPTWPTVVTDLVGVPVATIEGWRGLTWLPSGRHLMLGRGDVLAVASTSDWKPIELEETGMGTVFSAAVVG